MPRYQPADSFVTPRFSGIRTFARLPFTLDRKDVDATILGIPFDTGASFRTGARFGPAAIRDASVLLRPYNPVVGVDVFGSLSVTDGGDLPVVPGYIEDTYIRVEEGLREVHQSGIVPICLGGDHSITLAELRAAAAIHGPMSLVHFDAHSDTWDSYFGRKYNHGTTFRRAAEEGLLDTAHSIQVGARGPVYAAEDYENARSLGLQVLDNVTMREIGLPQTIKTIVSRVAAHPAFVTFDIDFVDPAYAPGTGTPEIGGVTSWEAQALVRGLHGIDIRGFDVVEVSPPYDKSEITALLAANLVYEFLTLLAHRHH